MTKCWLIALLSLLLLAACSNKKADDGPIVIEDIPFQGPGWSDTEGMNPHVEDAKFVHFDAPGADIPHAWADAKARLP